MLAQLNHQNHGDKQPCTLTLSPGVSLESLLVHFSLSLDQRRFYITVHNVKKSSGPYHQHMTYYTESLFMEQKLRPNTEAVCEKLSEPSLLPQELRG